MFLIQNTIFLHPEETCYYQLTGKSLSIYFDKLRPLKPGEIYGKTL
jgi:hypothetical protein